MLFGYLHAVISALNASRGTTELHGFRRAGAALSTRLGQVEAGRLAEFGASMTAHEALDRARAL